MILAGVLLKIGGYGLIRLAWPLAPAGAYDWSYFVAAAGRLQHPLRRPRGDGPDRLQEAGRLQLGQPHGLRHPGHGRDEPVAASPQYYAYGVNGAMFMMIAHGITSAGMFFLVGVIYDRAHTRDLNKLGGLNNIMPLYGGDLVRDLLRLDGPAGPLRVRRRGLRGAGGVQLQPGRWPCWPPRP